MALNDVDEQQPASGVQVIQRAAAILRSLKNQDAGLSLSQIADRVGLPRSTVQRLVDALKVERLVIAANPDGGIRLGPEIQSLAESGRIEIVQFCRPHLVSLSRQTGETVDLAVLRGDRLIFIDQIVGEQRLRAVSFVGETFPLTTTANGKAVLALFPDRIVADAVRRERPACSLADLLAELAEVRTSQVAFDLGEHSAGIKAAGAAFRDRSGTVYALSIPVPASRFDGKRAELTSALAGTAGTISRMIG